MNEETPNWIEEEEEVEPEDGQIEEYELTASPNDFNILTINSFIESGAVKIPGFQRHYVWDIKRASKLIESIIIGIPVPQIFLYEEKRNSFLVIDGQQRLMSIYYFIKQRFPRKEKRVELRRIFDEQGKIPDTIIQDDKYFEKFNLKLSTISSKKPNKFAGKNYSTLDEHKTQFELRTIRNVIVKQNMPKDDDSSIYEMFNRLNTGGINLTPQEIRASLNHSPFYQMLYKINMLPEWRRLLGLPESDLHMRDVEILLRSFAMLFEGHDYGSSMASFLNRFSKKARTFSQSQIDYCEGLFRSFIEINSALATNTFFGKTGKFSLPMFESIFVACCADAYTEKTHKVLQLDSANISLLKLDDTFLHYSQAQSTNKSNVEGRLKRAREILVKS